MDSRQVAAAIREDVVEDSIREYRKLFSETSPAEATGAWKGATLLYAQLDPVQREAFFAFIRQVAVDTTSHLAEPAAHTG